ncbi:MAG: RimK family alpha-L-glutamate ligase [Thermoplasmata archaeon]|nr:RimK family alpha-L-glutamate ligase [Thermoplasmata archaeon]
MARIGCFIEQDNLTHGPQLSALVKFHHAAMEQGHTFEFLFKDDIDFVPEYDAIFIRATTDPRNSTYVVSRLAELHGLKVIDDSRSISVCCNKVHLYMLMQKHRIPFPETCFLSKNEITETTAKELFKRVGKPIVLKAPTTNFSKHVEKVNDVSKFLKVAGIYFRRSDIIVAQEYVESPYDWRVGVLNGHVIFGAKYHMVNGYWKIRRTSRGKVLWGNIDAVNVHQIPDKVKRVALRAANMVGKGLYGVDIKVKNGNIFVIEVNDNPSIDAGYEDAANPEIYSKIISYLAAR